MTVIHMRESHPAGNVPNPPANTNDKGVEVLRRTVRAWERAIDDWTGWLQSRHLSDRTIYQRRWQLRKLAETYGHRSPWKLAPTDLEAWLARPQWGRDQAKTARSGVRSFYHWAVRNGRLKHSPAADLDPVQPARHLPRPAPEHRYRQALAAADPRRRLMLHLAYYAGLRVSEIGALRWADIADRQIIIAGKGDKHRIIPLHDTLGRELQRYRLQRAAGRYHADSDTLVFPGQNPHRGLSPSHVSTIMSAALGPGLTPHQLRHSFATRVLDATGDLAAVQDLLGHASPASTRIYTRVSNRALRAAIDAI